jgi:transcriptional regulator with XRE-family HTH domain
MMTIRELFSANFRWFCEKRGKISEISKGTGISRAQLNRYLRGTLPNSENLAVLAAYFDIDEAVFFQDFSGASHKGQKGSFLERFDKLVGSTLNREIPDFPEGKYFMYFELPENPSRVVRSAIFLNYVSNQLCFRRYTATTGLNILSRNRLFSSHRGLVLQRNGYLNFCAVNTRPGYEPTLMAMRSVPSDLAVFSGNALVMSTTQPVVRRAVMIPMSNSYSNKEFIKKSHICNLMDIDSVDIVAGLLSS